MRGRRARAAGAPLSRRLDRLLAPVRVLGEGAWAVGGGLRDALLCRPVADLDVAVSGDPRTAAAALARAHGARRFLLSHDWGAWRVHGGRLPLHVDVMPLQGTLADDLGRRDLTVNALAAPVSGGPLVDPHGGRADLAARRLRPVGPASLADDPVRVLRVARLAEQLGFGLDPVTVWRGRAAAPLLRQAAGERVLGELVRIARLAATHRALELADALRALTAVVPELEAARGLEQSPYHHRDVLGHTLEVVRHVDELVADPEPVFRSLAPRVSKALARPLAHELTAGEALAFPALLHDMAKPATHAVTTEGRITFMRHDRLGAEMADALLRRLRSSRRLREFTVACVRHHLPLGFMVHREPVSLRQIHRYLRATSPVEVEVVVLTVADRLATRGPRTRPSAIARHLALARTVLRAHFELLESGRARPLLTGAEIAAALGRPRGPWLRDALAALEEEQVVGRVRSRKDALRFVADLGRPAGTP